jgi:mannan endo-1,4-beta-mannosidase
VQVNGCLAARSAGGAANPSSTQAPPRPAQAAEPERADGSRAEAPTSTAVPMPGRNVRETRAARDKLQHELEVLAASPRFALGHEDTTAYGVGWSGDTDRSDVKDLCGSHVAVYGWDIFGLEKDSPKNGDGVDFEHMRRLIADAHRRGGINTISWHVHNPVSGGNAWDQRRAVHAILPGQPLHALYQGYLDRVANYLQSLRGDSGELIPIIFRPFHEHTGSWFWWGSAHTSAADYIALWRYSVDYLRYERGLDNLLFAFSPGGGEVRSDADYLYRYPGDEYVDVFGVDLYYGDDPADLVRVAEVVVRKAEAHGKIPAVTEFGARGGLNGPGIDTNWLVASFLAPLAKSPVASRIAYALAWRNASAEHCFLSYPAHAGSAAFKAFCDHEQVLLENDLHVLQ